MSINFNIRNSTGCGSSNTCSSKDGCPTDRCPDFTIRRHDTKPLFKVMVEDCDGPLDLQGLIVEANMWALAKLKCKISESDTYFPLASNIGFEQVMVGDIIVMDRVRMPEQMLVTGFDEENSLIQVQRGYRGTTPSKWKKGSTLRIFRIMNAPAETEMAYDDIEQVDGTTNEDELVGSYLIYEWSAEDTCLPGCFWFEFKLLKMIDVVYYLPGGNWVGEYHKHTDGFFYTGTSQTDSSVRLSYEQVEDVYCLPSKPWSGEVHLNDDDHFTGTVHNDGSVYLNQTGIPSENTVSYNEDGVSSSAMNLMSGIVPSFTDQDLTPYYFGCYMGEGVEWVRRFPLNGEGFLIKVSNSNTPG